MLLCMFFINIVNFFNYRKGISMKMQLLLHFREH